MVRIDIMSLSLLDCSKPLRNSYRRARRISNGTHQVASFIWTVVGSLNPKPTCNGGQHGCKTQKLHYNRPYASGGLMLRD